MIPVNEHLRNILALHFHPRHGAPYWLEREKVLGFDIQERIQTVDDLPLLGPMDLDALCRYPVQAFIPSKFADRPIICAETGGATGTPKSTAWFEEDLHQAFVQPFLQATYRARETWPKDGHWLWLGPGGPHVIGKVAHRIAQETTGSDAFSVDFDPRWFRRLNTGSVAATRYRQHVLDQGVRILNQQNIRYLFVTPAVLTPLIEQMTQEAKERIRFIYLGGMPVSEDNLALYQQQFPAAETLCGYGNTLFGVCHQGAGEGVCYYPASDQHIVQVVTLNEQLDDTERLQKPVAYGERGQVVMHRLTESAFLANVMERDSGMRITGERDGVANPGPCERIPFIVKEGIY